MGKKRQCQCMCFLPHFLVLVLSLFPTFSMSELIFDYGDALSKSLLYFEAQRSGRLPYNQRMRWRHHSGLTDGLEQGVDLVGGYYDAGDNVKFGLPMAFTITMLSWGVIEFRDQIAAAGELRHALEAIKWGTDYFIKAHTHPNVLWAQVGDGDTDHLCWQRPEDMTTSRRAYKLDEENPGSEVAAETAAAMAAASIVFRKTNPHYSHLLLEHAQQLFEFGDKFRGKYDESIEGAKGYYTSVSGYMDELLWAALWLHKATDNIHYFNYAIQNAFSFGGITWAITEFSWDVKYAGLQIIASMLPIEGKNKEQRQILQEYRTKAEHYICACLNKNNGTNVQRTPGGLLYTRQWNNMQYVSSTVFLLTVYSEHLHSTNQMLNCHTESAGHHQILSLVKSQVAYLLGSNPMGVSYLVGYGPTYPKRVHHRAASMESYRESKVFVGCTQGYDYWYGRKDPNPNVLVGALVGGPNSKDEFTDRRGNFVQTEACTYNTAPLVGVFAKLNALEKDNSSALSLVSSI
ncbi:Cellulase [Handroanthus impetiginosus]|uniref:Endoglucanase n=1 Tax=Handroanthus impetiginosus TaxID=429701 RepID=A0A2G9HJY8_9LAMI|nr:Cellulase [Handroanthus impetiginosus]